MASVDQIYTGPNVAKWRIELDRQFDREAAQRIGFDPSTLFDEKEEAIAVKRKLDQTADTLRPKNEERLRQVPSRPAGGV